MSPSRRPCAMGLSASLPHRQHQGRQRSRQSRQDPQQRTLMRWPPLHLPCPRNLPLRIQARSSTIQTCCELCVSFEMQVVCDKENGESGASDCGQLSCQVRACICSACAPPGLVSEGNSAGVYISLSLSLPCIFIVFLREILMQPGVPYISAELSTVNIATGSRSCEGVCAL